MASEAESVQVMVVCDQQRGICERRPATANGEEH